jgi:hypothetical protein
VSDNNSDVHQGDIGTKYKIRILDDGSPFDPTSATTRELIFKWNDGTVLARTGTLEIIDGQFYLTYTVNSGTFHSVLGSFNIQIRLIFPDGTSYHSSVVDSDDGGRILQILPNLDM